MTIMDPWIQECLREWSSPTSPDEHIRLAEVMRLTQQAIEFVASATTDQNSDMNRQYEIMLLKRQLESCESLFNAPIRHLPRDVLLDIFQLCDFSTRLELLHERSSNQLQIQTHDSFSLISVCTTWYKLASSTPSLWSRLEIQIEDPNEVLSSRQILQHLDQTLHGMLKRTGQVPLDVSIHIEQYSPLAFPILLPFLQECHRWKYLELQIPKEQLGDNKLGELFRNGLQALEVLKFELSRMDRALGVPAGVICDWFSNARSLKKVEQNYVDLGLLTLSWEQLETLHVYGFSDSYKSTNQHVNILSQAISLHTLEFGFEFTTATSHTRPPSFKLSLPNIISLKTYFLADSQFFHHYFTLPNLTSLTVGGDDWSPGFLEQVSPTLRRLVFDDYPFHGFPVTFFTSSSNSSNICFPQLKELIIIRSYGVAEGSITTIVPADLRKMFPKLALFQCKLGTESSDKLEIWFQVFCALNSFSGITTQLTLRRPYLKDMKLYPVLRALRERGTVIKCFERSGIWGGVDKESEVLWEEWAEQGVRDSYSET